MLYLEELFCHNLPKEEIVVPFGLDAFCKTKTWRSVFKVFKISLACLSCIEVQKGYMMDVMSQHVGKTFGHRSILLRFGRLSDQTLDHILLLFGLSI